MDVGFWTGDNVASLNFVPGDAGEVEGDSLVRVGGVQRPVVNLDRAHPRAALIRQQRHPLAALKPPRPESAGDHGSVPCNREDAVDVEDWLFSDGSGLMLTPPPFCCCSYFHQCRAQLH